MFKQFIFLLLGIFAVAVAATAQECMYRYTHYTVADGLPTPMVYDMVQDKQGYIWLATESGLVKYDGYTFKTLTTRDGLPGNDVLKLFLDKEDRLWMIFYQEGVGYLDDGVYHQVPDHVLPKASYIFSQDVHENGEVWIGTGRRGLYVLRDTNLVVQYYAEVKEAQNKHTSLYSCTDPEGNIWTSTYSYYGCCGIDPKKKFLINQDVLGVKDNFFPTYLGAELGMGVYTRKVVSVIRGDEVTPIFPRPGSGDRFDILGLDTLSNGKLCVSTKKGVYLVYFDNEGQLIHDPLMLGEQVSGVLEDGEGNLWISTLTNGVYFINVATRKIELLIPDMVESLELKEREVWVGTKLGKVFVIKDSIERRFAVYGAGALLTPAINDIYWEPGTEKVFFCADNYFMITRNGDFSQVDTLHYLDTGHFTHLGHTYFDTLGSEMMYIGAPKKVVRIGNDYYVSAANGMYIHRDMDTLIHETQYLMEGRVLDICSDPYGRLWMADQYGIRQYDLDSVIDVKKEALGAYITRLVIDSVMNRWIGTNGHGLFIKTDDTLVNLSIERSAASNSINDILLLEHEGEALIATNNGVYHVNYSNYNLEAYPLPDNSGLPSRVVKELLLNGTDLYMATTQGLVRTSYNVNDRDTTNYPVIIQEVLVNGVKLPLQNSYELEYDQNDINITFVGLNYSSERQIRYRYRLEENANWIESGLTEVQFSSLAPGSYIFQVLAKSINGTWHNRSTNVHFLIKAPFWQTNWFLLLVVGGIVLIIIIIATVYVRYNRNRDKIARRLVELEGQALRSQMNPHFIFNSLNAVHDFIADSDQRSAHLYLSRFAKLIRTILDHSRRTLVTLDDEIETLKLYIQLEQMRFEGKFEYEFQVEEYLDVGVIKVAPMIIQPYVENAIRHGIMNRTDSAGKLTLRIFTEGNELVCCIEDNGVGRVASAQINQKHDTKHKSYAMEITHERLTQLNTLGKDKGRVEVEDLIDDNGMALGTRVTVRFYLEDGDQ